MAAVTMCSDFGAPKNKVWHNFHCFPIYFPWSDGTRCHDLRFLNVLKVTKSLLWKEWRKLWSEYLSDKHLGRGGRSKWHLCEIWRWGLWEIIRFTWGQGRGLMKGLVSLKEETPESLLPLFLCHMRTVRRQPSINQEENQGNISASSYLGFPSLQNCKK